MTVTEASRDASSEAAAPPAPSAPPAGLAAVVGSGDPRTIGKLFIGTSLLFLLASGVIGALVDFEVADASGSEIFGADTTLRMLTLHSTSALLLGVLPLLIGVATAVVPLQVGASTVAFPRASAASYWVWLVSGGILCVSYAVDGGPWGTSEDGVSLFVLSLIAVAIALFVATASVVTTVLTLRAPGMSLRRTPLFSWSVLVGGTGWLLTLPVLAAMLLLTYVDLRYGQQFLGGSAGVYNRIAWLFWQPTLYLVAVPALGIVADVVPVFAQRRHQSHGAAMFLLGLSAALAVGAWAQTGVTIDGGVTAPWLQDGPWNVVSFLAIVPVLGLFGLWNLTLLKGKVRISTPLILAQLGALAVLAGCRRRRRHGDRGPRPRRHDLDDRAGRPGARRRPARRARRPGVLGAQALRPTAARRRHPARGDGRVPRRPGGGGDTRHRRGVRPAPRARGGSASSPA